MAKSQAALLSRLALAVASEPESSPLTLRVCRATRDLLGAEGASITLENSTPNRVTLCATDEPAGLLENLQDVLGEGPCRDAFDLGEPVETALDLSATGRWPQVTAAAALIRDPLAFAAYTTSAQPGGWSSRAQIHQATGMLASRLHISVDDAFALLRSHAFTAGIELADVAAAVVERRLDLSGE